jgi:hypothetical protein
VRIGGTHLFLATHRIVSAVGYGMLGWALNDGGGRGCCLDCTRDICQDVPERWRPVAYAYLAALAVGQL